MNARDAIIKGWEEFSMSMCYEYCDGGTNCSCIQDDLREIHELLNAYAEEVRNDMVL